jgi:hypothetical protein
VTVEVLHEGECRLVLSPLDELAAVPAELEAVIAAVWERECARRPGLFNGVLLSAVELSGDTLRVRLSEYRQFLAQRSQVELADRLGINPVAVSGLVVTSDDRWLFGRRGSGVTQYPLHFEAVPSGALDERAFAGSIPTPGLVLDPIKCLLNELYEEAGIDVAAVADVRPVGLFLDVEERTYDLAYVVRLARSGAELRGQLSAHSHEYHALETLHTDEVGAVMSGRQVVPTTKRLWQTVQRSVQEGNR